MELQYHIIIHGERIGPLSSAQVRQRINDGEVHSKTPIWHEGLDGWKPCGEVLKEVPEPGVWFAMVNSQRIGPLSEGAFKQAVLIGQIKPETRVWKQGMPKWRSWGNYSKEQGIVMTTLDPKTLGGGLTFEQPGNEFGADMFDLRVNEPPKTKSKSTPTSKSNSNKSGGGLLSRLTEKLKRGKK
jgi:hypothetical protein